jgi:hypothetical protein
MRPPRGLVNSLSLALQTGPGSSDQPEALPREDQAGSLPSQPVPGPRPPQGGRGGGAPPRVPGPPPQTPAQGHVPHEGNGDTSPKAVTPHTADSESHVVK